MKKTGVVKKRFLTLSMLLLLACGKLQATVPDRIVFEPASLTQAIQAASHQGKYVFIDVRAPWCAPCKAMEERVFTEASVSGFWQQHFVSLQVDIEQTEDAALLAQFDYYQTSLPALLFFDPQGELVHVAKGYQSASELLGQARLAIDPSQHPATYRRRYEAGERSPYFLADYVRKLKSMDDPRLASVQGELLQQLPEDQYFDSKLQQAVYAQTDKLDAPHVQYLCQNMAAYNARYGAGQAEAILYLPWRDAYVQALLAQDDAQLETARNRARQIFGPLAPDRIAEVDQQLGSYQQQP
ncbi:MAG: thioredoxin family protein [Bacteroidetes bacterium]|nr:thioredoxin family protein [Bacteroidota bacterium]